MADDGEHRIGGGATKTRLAGSKALTTLPSRGVRAVVERAMPRALAGAIVVFGIYFVGYHLSGLLTDPDRLFGDADIYYQATATWLAGGDPWAARYDGRAFAGVPPTLLLNLPLQSFGLESARPFWAIAGLVAGAGLMLRLGLAWWWVAFPPYWEGVLNGNPDPVLLAIAVVGGGALSACTKPYSVPGLLADGRWRAVMVGGILGVATVPLLPWAMFLEHGPDLAIVLRDQTLHTSAWGNWPVAIAVSIALVSLGPRLGFGLVVPTLWPSAQIHYNLFSVPTVKRSVPLAFGLSYPHLAAPTVIVYAICLRVARSRTMTIDPSVRGGAGVPTP